MVWVINIGADAAGWPDHILTIASSLLGVWIVIRLTSQLVRNPALAKLIAFTAWVIAALNIVDLLDPTVELLDETKFTIGKLQFSALTVVTAVLSLAVLLSLAFLFARIFEDRIKKVPDLNPSIQVLFAKLLKIVLVTMAVLLAFGSVGIDLTALAVLGGAIGVGIGFGLQKIVANFISGIILLLDRSIKPGDVIVVGNTFGWINRLSARYVSVITRDGTEHLVPNETLITEPVENWSYTSDLVRFKIPIGVSYGSDVHKARDLAVAAASGTDRILAEPKPICHLVGFGDSSVDLELRVWIKDPRSGVTNVLSNVRLAIWDAFRKNGIEFPFPQRDLHLRTVEGLPAELRRPQRRPRPQAKKEFDTGQH